MLTLKNDKVQAWIILGLVWLGAFIASYAQNQLAGMSIQFQEHYGFTGEQYAAIYSASQLLGVFLAFVTGIISDKIGTRKIILIAGVVVSISLIARIFAFSFEAQYVANMMSGFTGLFIAVNRSKILGGWFTPSMLALAVGISATTTPVANTVGIGLTSLMPSVEFAFTVTAVIAVAFTVMWFLFGKDASDEIAAQEAAEGEVKESVLKTLADVAKSPWAWVLALAAMFCMAGQVPLMAFTTAALQTLREMDAVGAGGMATAITIGMGVGSVVSPIIVRALKSFRIVIAIYGVLTALVIYFGWQMPVGPIMYAVFFVGGFTLGYLMAIIFTLPVMLFGRDKAGTAQGLVQTFLLIGASVFLTNVTIPLAGGANPGTFPTIFLIAAVFVIIGSVLMFIIPDQGKKMVKKGEPEPAKAE
ncbi:MAG: MFS transporter [Eggerthellaceae bacterium]|nr:MFS transporter [Eggerthellaceae bacterium]